MEVRAPRPRTAKTDPVKDESSKEGGSPGAAGDVQQVTGSPGDEPEAKRQRVHERRIQDSLAIDLDSDSEVEEVSANLKPARNLQVKSLQQNQVLRISAGRAAAAAGIHPFADVWELFVELVYQDLPEMLLLDAAFAGVEIVSPAAERAHLLHKSGEGPSLEAALKASREAQGVEGTGAAKEAVRMLLSVAEKAKRLTAQEAADLSSILEMEINVEFGARHEDAAIQAYSARVGQPVYGEQRRVSVALPNIDPGEALAKCFPAPTPAESSSRSEAKEGQASEKPLFRLTGFVDGMVDLPQGGVAVKQGEDGPKDTLVIEVKHRMGKIKDPPEVYDIVQLGSYCRAFGCKFGHLVQCLRQGNEVGSAAGGVGTLHITRLDYSADSQHGRGWDKHVLPGLYNTAAAVYKVRENQEARVRLLAASPLEAHKRAEIVGELCPHLAR